MDKITILNGCTIDGNTVKLPPIQLERELYLEVSKAINLIGGKWKGGKVSGFVFMEDPTELMASIRNGNKKNLKKEYQFFATPPDLARKMVELAQIEEYDLILEPSAGQGAIIKAIQQKTNSLVHYCELMELNRSFLSKIPNTVFLKDNFLLLNTPTLFHKIIANPPFSNNQDIKHVLHMWKTLVPGGTIITITSRHWEFSNNKQETTFREFIRTNNAKIELLPSNTFKESGTSIETNLIVINKPLN